MESQEMSAVFVLVSHLGSLVTCSHFYYLLPDDEFASIGASESGKEPKASKKLK